MISKYNQAKKMSGLTTEYLQNLMKICSFDPNAFKGVFSCDNFYIKVKDCHILSPGDAYIINLSSSNHSGSHWVAVHVNTPQEVEYFDPYGLDCFDNFIKKAFEEQNITISTFKKTIQDSSSQFCGLYCVAYLLCRELYISKPTFASFFDDNELFKNDIICVEIIKDIIKIAGI